MKTVWASRKPAGDFCCATCRREITSGAPWCIENLFLRAECERAWATREGLVRLSVQSAVGGRGMPFLEFFDYVRAVHEKLRPFCFVLATIPAERDMAFEWWIHANLHDGVFAAIADGRVDRVVARLRLLEDDPVMAALVLHGTPEAARAFLRGPMEPVHKNLTG